MSSVIDTLETVFAFLAVIGISWWIGTIYMAEDDERLVQACVPIEWSTNGLHHLTTALVGYPPSWTLSLQSYLMGGCYYFFSVMLPNDGKDLNGNIILPAQGGLHK